MQRHQTALETLRDYGRAFLKMFTPNPRYCPECGREVQTPPFDCKRCERDGRRIEGDW